MELLSFTYLFLELCLLGLLIYGAIVKWWLILVAVGSYFIYPLFYESILKVFYSLIDKCTNSTKLHSQSHQKFKQKNGLIYKEVYNIKVLGIEKQHPFDSCKYERTMDFILKTAPELKNFNCQDSGDPDYKFLYTKIELPHLILLNYSLYLSKIAEIPVCWMPSIVLRLLALRRFLYASQGTIIGSCVALEKSLAINIGGGFHHAHANGASGFCFYNDIGLAIEHLWKFHGDRVQKILIIDLDAHQGNGHERDKLRLYNKLGLSQSANKIIDDEPGIELSHKLSLCSKQIFIIDAFNPFIFPNDSEAKKAIDIEIQVTSSDRDATYLKKIENGLEALSRTKFVPDFIFYNAGTDILKGDRLGNLNISEEGIIRRDELVFGFARYIDKPLLMLLSGGYQFSNAPLISKSIINLNQKFPGILFK